MLTYFQYRILKAISPREPTTMSGAAYRDKSKLLSLLGPDILEELRGKIVIDFGCGEGKETIELAQRGVKKLIGLDIRESALEAARSNAAIAQLGDLCQFTTQTNLKADVIVSIDAFEHFDDPAAILKMMDSLLTEDGRIIASFGPTWYHPYGGHLFSVFPWSHLIFTEKALIRWRNDIRSDGATRFNEVEGGLNRMTIRKFKDAVNNSPFKICSFEAVPIRRLRHIHSSMTQEFSSAIVRCVLTKKAKAT